MRAASSVGLLCLILLPPLSARGGEPIPATESPAPPPRVEILSSDDRAVHLRFELPGLRTGRVSRDGREFTVADIPEGGFAGKAGEPAIPIYTRLIAVPEGATVRVASERIETETLSGVRLIPAQADEGGPFAYDDRAYERPGGGEPDVAAGAPARLRDLTVVPLTFQPVHYDPPSHTMTVVKELDVEIVFENAAPPKRTGGGETIVPESFDRLYRNVVLNYEGPAANQTVAPGTIVMVTADDPAIADSIAPLVEWRTRKGSPVIVTTMAEAGGTRSAVRNYIRSLYEDPAVPLEYVVIVGDAGSGDYLVPTYREPLSGYFGEGDHPYTKLAGSDVLSDVHLGRLSFSTMDELSLIVSKIVRYETAPYMENTNWFDRAVIVGDPYASGYSTVETGRWLTERLAEIGYTRFDTLFQGSFVSQMYAKLNKGDSVFGYRGIYGMSGWSNAMTYILTNGWELPFCVTLTCATGSFESATSYSEGFLRAGSINPLVVKGGIGAIGTASTGTHTRYNNCMYYGIWRGFTVEGMHDMGSPLTRGKLEVYLNYHDDEPDIPEIWSHWNNLMGDPALHVWTAIPESLSVAHAASIPLGAGSVPVEVAAGGAPVEGAQVCLWKGDEVYEVRHTGAGGTVDIPVAPATEGELLITVSGENLLPYIDSIAVAGGMHVGPAGVAVDDDGAGGSAGNGDGLVNPGESIELAVELENFGAEEAGAVVAYLSTSDLYVGIHDNHELYGDIPAGGAAFPLDDYDFTVGAGCRDGHVIPFAIDAYSDTIHWHSVLEVEVHSSSLVAGAVTLFNEGGDGRVDPGETVDLSVKLFNNGSTDAADVTANLVSLSPGISVEKRAASFGAIAVSDTVDNGADRFTITAASETYEGHTAAFELRTLFSGGRRDTTWFAITVGERSASDPAGPDSYGYYAFDNTDVGFAESPVYDWVELDPAYGGDGIEVVMNDNGQYEDETVVVDLPFPFSYYGTEYSEASINSNGWVAMGETALISYRNWTIPGAGGPNAMIAPFWDNLYQGAGSRLFRKYDSADHRWIVEWSRMLNFHNGAVETFEAILYDGAYHPTITGDGPIVFQYLTVANVDPVDGYATVGIENADQSDGVLCTYWNLYEGGVDVIEAGRAIRFLPHVNVPNPTEVADAPIPAAANQLDPCRPNPFNPATTISWRLASRGPVSLRVFDVSGRLVATLADGEFDAGAHSVVWNGRSDAGRDAASGVYFVRLEGPDFRQVRELTLVR